MTEALGILVNGLLLGSLYGLFGLGLAFAFGVMRVVNVAHGEFIVLAAYMGLTIAHFLPLGPAPLVLLVAAIAFVLGYALQASLLNRLMSADPLPVLLVTYGLSIILRNLMVEVFGADPRSLDVGALKVAGVDLFGIRMGVLPLILAATSVALFVLLEVGLRTTRFGRVLRATADDAATVRLFGVNHRRVFSVAMGIAVALSAVAGSLLSMRTGFTPFAGVDRLLISFEVVIVGGIGSFWGTLVGGLLLGVAQLIGLRIAPQSGLLFAHLVFFAVLMFLPSGIAGWRKRGAPPAANRVAAKSVGVEEPRRLDGRSLLATGVAVLVALASAPALLDAGDLRLMIEALSVLTMAQMWNLLAGYAGRMSMGHQAFVGLGAYATFLFSNTSGFSPYWSLLVAPIVCAIAAAALAPFLFRLRDAYFAIGMWVFAEALAIVVGLVPQLGRQYGLNLERLHDVDPTLITPILYGLAAGLALASTAGVYLLLKSRVGLALVAVRENERTAAATGIDVWRYQAIAFVISAAGVGLAGAIFFTSEFHVVPQSTFDPGWTAEMLFICLIGGVGTIEGPVIGAIVYFAAREALQNSGNWYLIAMGVVAVCVMCVAPQGIWGLVARAARFEFFSTRRTPSRAEARLEEAQQLNGGNGGLNRLPAANEGRGL